MKNSYLFHQNKLKTTNKSVMQINSNYAIKFGTSLFELRFELFGVQSIDRDSACWVHRGIRRRTTANVSAGDGRDTHTEISQESDALCEFFVRMISLFCRQFYFAWHSDFYSANVRCSCDTTGARIRFVSFIYRRQTKQFIRKVSVWQWQRGFGVTVSTNLIEFRIPDREGRMILLATAELFQINSCTQIMQIHSPNNGNSFSIFPLSSDNLCLSPSTTSTSAAPTVWFCSPSMPKEDPSPWLSMT